MAALNAQGWAGAGSLDSEPARGIAVPVSKLDTFREDVRQFLRATADTRANILLKYVINKAPEISGIWPGVVDNNDKFMKRQVTIRDLWSAVTREEMLAMTGMLRNMTEQVSVIRLEQNPVPPDVKIESVEADGVQAEWQIVPGASEEKILMYLHGGGWIFGSAFTHRVLTVAVGKAAGMQVLSVNYRLAPENPFPAGLEDCAKVYRWLLLKGFKPSNIIIAGDSAGGNLTLAGILNLRDKGLPLPKGAVCLSPATNLQFDAFHPSNAESDPILADIGIFWWVAAYVGLENSAGLKNPLVSPILGDLGGFPPLLIQATPAELLFEDARQFVEKVRAAGGNATLQLWGGMVHVWQLFFYNVFPESKDAIDKIGEWVRNLYAMD